MQLALMQSRQPVVAAELQRTWEARFERGTNATATRLTFLCGTE
jgi:hypothetical protein